MKFRLMFALVFSGIVLVCQTPATAQSMAEKKVGVYGTVIDEAGTPVPEITILLVPNTATDSPMKVQTSKKGAFVFPAVEFNPDYYRLKIESSEWFVRKYKIRTRRASGEIWQDDEGSLGPTNQDKMVELRYRGGNATVEFVLAKIADFKVAPAPGQTAAAQGGVPAAERSFEDMAEEATAMGDYKAAAELLTKALEAKPDDPELLYKHAQAMARNGDLVVALREGQKVLLLSPERKEIRRKMAAWMMDRGDMDGALPLLEKEKSLDPENPAVAKLLVTVYDSAGRKEDMGKEAERWLQLAPKDTEAVLTMANIKTEAGDFAAAEKLFQDLASSDPENAPTMYFNAGVSTMNKPGLGPEDRKRAITAFKKAVELNPKMAKAYMRMGECYLGLGDYPTARAQFEQFLKVASPDDPEVKDAKDMIKALPTK